MCLPMGVAAGNNGSIFGLIPPSISTVIPSFGTDNKSCRSSHHPYPYRLFSPIGEQRISSNLWQHAHMSISLENFYHAARKRIFEYSWNTRGVLMHTEDLFLLDCCDQSYMHHWCNHNNLLLTSHVSCFPLESCNWAELNWTWTSTSIWMNC